MIELNQPPTLVEFVQASLEQANEWQINELIEAYRREDILGMGIQMQSIISHGEKIWNIPNTKKTSSSS